ncbi:FAD-dependent oxidoreductase [Candidatus Uhrbacteria bacterium]|nr:FAD-dependent oxidoreductase [Candidatus Uhrbacteria bacterium]
MQEHDVVVIGAGPAGLAAAMFTARRGLRTILVAKDIGGQLALTDWIENYPGIARIGGRALVDAMLAQVQRDGAEMLSGEAIAIQTMEQWNNGTMEHTPGPNGLPLYDVRLAEGDGLRTRTVILSFGLTPNDLGCDGEARLKGKGLYYSAVADAPRQDGKTIAIVGGGNSAVTAALELAPRAAKVYLIHRRSEFRAEKKLLDRLREHTNVEIRAPFAIVALEGGAQLERLILAPTDPHTGTPITDPQLPAPSSQLPVDSVFVQIGFSAKTKWLDGVVALNAKREVIIDRDCATSAPGIFAAGDLTDITYKQAVVTAGEGVKAALQAFKYLATAAGKPAVMFDWDAKNDA